MTQTLLETVESALVRLPAEECFDLLLRSMDEFRTQVGNPNPGLWAHPQMVLQRGGKLATAYESFMSRGREESVKFEHALISQRIRDIIVVLCIRWAGTHGDEDKFRNAVLTMFGKSKKSHLRHLCQQLESEVWSQIHG